MPDDSLPPKVVDEICQVLEWIEAHPRGHWQDMDDLFEFYTRWRDIIRGVPRLLNDNGTMRTVSGLTGAGRIFLIKHRSAGMKVPKAREGTDDVSVMVAGSVTAVNEALNGVTGKGGDAGAENANNGEIRNSESTRSAISFSEWGIGYDPGTGWHVFQLRQHGWKYARKKLVVPRGLVAHMLIALLKGRGILDRKEIYRFYDGTGGRPKKLNSCLTRLRRVIGEKIGLVHEKLNVLPKVQDQGSWQLRIRIGHAEKIDTPFVGADPEFSFTPCE